jgi:hypothetical protein
VHIFVNKRMQILSKLDHGKRENQKKAKKDTKEREKHVELGQLTKIARPF